MQVPFYSSAPQPGAKVRKGHFFGEIIHKNRLNQSNETPRNMRFWDILRRGNPAVFLKTARRKITLAADGWFCPLVLYVAPVSVF